MRLPKITIICSSLSIGLVDILEEPELVGSLVLAFRKNKLCFNLGIFIKLSGKLF